MILFPAINLYEGKAVRLLRGDYHDMTVYDSDPAKVGRAFAKAGAEWIHTVDLEGAKTGETPNFDTVLQIKRESGCKVEIGGGIRELHTVERYLSSGIDRVILGTAALRDEQFLRQAVAEYGAQIAVGADLRDGFVAVKGWTETSDTTADDFCKRMQEIGVQTLIVTDISRDGAMKGTNRELYRFTQSASSAASRFSSAAVLRKEGMSPVKASPRSCARHMRTTLSISASGHRYVPI